MHRHVVRKHNIAFLMRWTLLLLPFLLLGCKNTPVRHIAVSPAVSVSQAGAVEIKGDAQVAPKVDTKRTDSKMALPEGTKLEFNEKLGVFTVTLAKASELAVNRQETAIAGPVAFTPDKGPTVAEESAAKSDFWTILGLRAGIALGAAACIFGLVRGWDLVMYGGAAVAGASLFGLFVQKHPTLLLIIGLGVALVVVGPLIWHTKLKKITPPPA